jgi:predicted CxxxxCH...CXXCH cytochrome family protein
MTSCHAAPPDGLPPVGANKPNLAYAHGVHLALANVTCGTCHFGAGTGTPSHAKVPPPGGYTSATVKLRDSSAVSFKAKTFTSFGYDGGKCSGVTCHGGKLTPSWNGGTLSLDNCDECHAIGVLQYNSYNSGSHPVFGNLHDFHIRGAGAVCIDCHDKAKLALQHFVGLDSANDSNFAGPAENTVGSALITNTGAGADYKATKSCTASCHHPAAELRSWVQ